MSRPRGTIAWFAHNGVAANLLMALLIVAGLMTAFTVKQEVFPEFSLDLISITVPYRGAAPAEVEGAVCVRIEEAIQGIDGVKRITSNAAEGVGTVFVELMLGEDSRRVLDDVKSRVDAIDTFPVETEKPIIRELTNRREVVSVAVWGDASEKVLRRLGERVRDDVSALDGITNAELSNARPYEISIEVSDLDLQRHELTFDQVANAVRRTSLDLPGGSVRAASGEILLRTKGEAQFQRDFEQLVLLTRPDGTRLQLGDVARVVDGFEDTDQSTRFNGMPAQIVRVFRVGEQDALTISRQAHQYVEERGDEFPEGIQLTVWNDASRILKDRRNLLIRNGAGGLVLVFLALALFLRFRLAFWVVVGLFISFMGAMALMPVLDVSINVISLFAFILVLGIVVDDAIVAGENIYTWQRRTGKGRQGAIDGAREVSVPVVFAVLTTVAAFAPLMNVPGATGKVMRVIPLIVIPCLLWSLVESLWILPAHLSHYRQLDPNRRVGPWVRFQRLFADGLESFVKRFYSPLLELSLKWRYATIAIGLSTLLLTVGLVIGGHIGFVFFPNVESDYVSVAITLPPGTPAERTELAVRQLEESAVSLDEQLREKYGESAFKYRVAAIGSHPFTDQQAQNAGGVPGGESASHLGELTIELTPSEIRTVGSEEIVALWRDLTGPIPDAIATTYTSSLFSAGDDVNVQLIGPDLTELQQVADEVKRELANYPAVYEISDSFRPGKEELKLDIKPGAEILGLTLADLGRQVRQAFYGEEAQRIQRGRDDVRVMVRYPESERRSLGDVENMHIRMMQTGPDGQPMPIAVAFSEVADVDYGRGYSTIKRVDRQRAINVTADVDAAEIAPGEIVEALKTTILPTLLENHPRVHFTFEGQQAEQRDTLGGLARGFVIAMIAIYALLAIPLRSYGQPLVIMAAIPFGFVGAVWGHALIGFDLTILSMFGFVALAGVVVNDSLVMVDFINRHRRHTAGGLEEAVRNAGVARFRPILLTSLTTFAGLSPLMLERSMQARFLIPMAVSLSFGVLFATVITLVFVPCGYLMLEDARRSLFGNRDDEETAQEGDGGRPAPQPIARSS